METIMIPKVEYEFLQETLTKMKLIDNLIHQKKVSSSDAIANTYGIAKNKKEQPFTKEVREKIALAHTPERAKDLLLNL